MPQHTEHTKIPSLKEWKSLFPHRYSDLFSGPQQTLHRGMCAELAEGRHYVLHTERIAKKVFVTVMAPDVFGIFSMITGCLVAKGLRIESGDVFTSQSPIDIGGAPCRYIIDRFMGNITVSFSKFVAELKNALRYLLGDIVPSDNRTIMTAHRRTAEVVAESVRTYPIASTFESALITIDAPDERQDGAQAHKNIGLTLSGPDTPFFLYTMSLVLQIRPISIERVEIRVEEGRMSDYFEIAPIGQQIESKLWLDDLRLTASLTQRFTYFLYSAPDPYRAIERFKLLVQGLQTISNRGDFIDLLSSPHVLRDLARLLGTSDFLWEEFIQSQYEMVIPMLDSARPTHLKSRDPKKVRSDLERSLHNVHSYEEKVGRLNDFKNSEIYMIDLDHILWKNLDFFFLSSRLTVLAEAVVDAALQLATDRLRPLYGQPRTAAGIAARYAVLGLGKLGGAALGYASDIELLFVYSDLGMTDGAADEETRNAKKIENSDYFERLIRETIRVIQTKREGIFRVDTRLRPHGNDGVMAIHLGAFVNYYQTTAVELEKLALVRLRYIAGDREFGLHLEHIRDTLIYANGKLNLQEIEQFRRAKQGAQLDGRINVKYSPGGLADLEFCVQVLQIKFGHRFGSLRTPKIHKALRALAQKKCIEVKEAKRLTESYRFMRRVINGLRMLRGNALDLYLPLHRSLEYQHLARRLGFEESAAASAATQLHIECETTMAYVRAFAADHLHRSVHNWDACNVADIILAPRPLSVEHREAFIRFLTRNHFSERALTNLLSITEHGDVARCADVMIIAWTPLVESPDSDMALNNWERFVEQIPIESRNQYWKQLHRQPQRIELLIHILAGSQFLADTLIHNRDFFDWVTSPHVAQIRPGIFRLRRMLGKMVEEDCTDSEWKNEVRRFRRRELLRIGMRDICLGIDIADITEDLSDLAIAIVQSSLERAKRQMPVRHEFRYCLLAFGKLGGRELNYSSDLDLVPIYWDNSAAAAKGQKKSIALMQYFTKIIEKMRADLVDHTAQGYVYRLDFRLRPYGSVGALVNRHTDIVNYYMRNASQWEYQALLKASVIAGDRRFGKRLLAALHAQLREHCDPPMVVNTIMKLRKAAHTAHGKSAPRVRIASAAAPPAINIKDGIGGIRDIEFLIQGLQLIHFPANPALAIPNTLQALNKLVEMAILPANLYAELRHDYIFLRRIEHFLQILEDRQIHTIPNDSTLYAALVRRIRRIEPAKTPFRTELSDVMARVHTHFSNYLQATL